MNVLPTYLLVYIVHVVPTEIRGGYQIPGTGVAEDYNPPCGYQGLHLGHLQKQEMLLATKQLLSTVTFSYSHSC